MFKQKFHHNKIVDFTLKAIVLSEMVLIVFGLGDTFFGMYLLSKCAAKMLNAKNPIVSNNRFSEP